ncbi:hypothetical protein [Pseudalkalibacillus hwajinpoensis]|uniref:hypothetical protein n=1 Tax=Guptibacillus hwajinpoensis TaxID=208199 RepID=UPI001CFD8916|nr:hypothetical protein [Pseudalkalibacillus hwajinpoensis]
MSNKLPDWYENGLKMKKGAEKKRNTDSHLYEAYMEVFGVDSESHEKFSEKKKSRKAAVTLLNGKTIEVDALDYNYRPLREHVTANTEKYLFVGGTYVNKDAIASFVDADEEEVNKALDEERKDQAKYEDEAEKLAESVYKENEHKFKDYGHGIYREV